VKRFTLIAGLVLLVFLVSLSLAEIPRLINYQGMLTTPAGNPVTDGQYNLTFKIYGSESGDDSLWWEHHSGVQVTDGLFNVILGSISSISSSVFQDSLRYLGIQVETDLELTPRIRLTSVSYAYRSLVADSAVVAVSAPTGGGWIDEGTAVRLVTDTDKVGIGTSTPGAQLEVSSTGEVDMWLNRGDKSWAAVLDFRRGGSHDWAILTPSGDTSLLILNQNFDVVQSFLQNGNVGIGTASPNAKLDVSGHINTADSYLITGNRVLTAPGNDNTFVGINSGTANTGNKNTFLGESAGFLNTSGSGNTFLGSGVGYMNTTGGNNTFIGREVGKLSTGSDNVFVGSGSGAWNTSGSFNTYLGSGAGFSNSKGINNTFLGCNAGLYDTGSGNVFIGYQAGYNEKGFNKLYIANSNVNPPLIYGDFSTGNIGLGTTNPTRKLHIVGDNPRILIEASSINPEVNFRNSGDSDSEFWSLYKHGTTDDFRFYQNGDKVTIQNGTGNVGIGTTNPQRALHISDVLRLQPRGSAPSNPSEGDIYVSSSNHHIYCYLDGTWKQLDN